jgi:hypothetical protein
MTNKTTNLTFRVSAELKQKFVEEAKANGTTATALFHQWMEDYINGKKPSTDNVSADSTDSTDTAQTSTDNVSADMDETINSLWESIRELKIAIEGNFATMGVNDHIRQLSENQHRFEKRLDNLKDCFDGVSCQISTATAPTIDSASTNSTDDAQTDGTDNVSADNEARTAQTTSTNNAPINTNPPVKQQNGGEDAQIEELEANKVEEEKTPHNETPAFSGYDSTVTDSESESAIAPEESQSSVDCYNWQPLEKIAETLGISKKSLSEAASKQRKGRENFRFRTKGLHLEVAGKGQKAKWRVVPE